jgi:hypothetical protein
MDTEAYEGRFDKGYDLLIDNNRISVKGTEYYRDPALIVAPTDMKSDIYFLVSCAPEKNVGRIQGIATVEMVESKPLEPFRPGSRPSRSLLFDELIGIKPRRANLEPVPEPEPVWANDEEGIGENIPTSAVYYVDTGKPQPDFLRDKPVVDDKRRFFKGDWRKAWPRDFEVKEGEICKNKRLTAESYPQG